MRQHCEPLQRAHPYRPEPRTEERQTIERAEEGEVDQEEVDIEFEEAVMMDVDRKGECHHAHQDEDPLGRAAPSQRIGRCGQHEDIEQGNVPHGVRRR